MKKIPKSFIGIWLLTFVVVLSMLITATLAWFSLNTEVDIYSPTDENLAIQVNSGDLMVSYSVLRLTNGVAEYTDYSNYGQTLVVSAAMPKFIDVTGNGSVLYFPTMMYEDANGNADPRYSIGDNWQEVTTAVGYAINVRLKFSTSQTMDVYLDKQSYVSPLENTTGGSYTRSSAYGDFSCDGIAGCARVAFFEITENDGNEVQTLKNIWIPNDKFCLSSGIDQYYFSESGERESSYGYYLKDGDHMTPYSYTIDDYLAGRVTVGSTDLADNAYLTVNSAAPLLSFEANGQVQEKEMLIRIWFEGTDREADTALDGGILKYMLKFAGIQKAEVSSETQTAINQIYHDTYLRWIDTTDCYNQIQYSYDGIDWANYGTNCPLDLTKPFVYVRSLETLTSKPSVPKRVVINN